MTEQLSYTDNRLLQLIAQQDREALKVLYKRYWTQLYDIAFQRLKNSQQAEDIVQDIFITIWERSDSLRIDNLGAYLRTAVRRRVLNYVTRNRAPQSFYEPLAIILADTAGADELLLQKEMLELLRLYIETLPQKRKQIFLLHLYNNLSTKEIAERLSISQKTVQNQLHSTMQALKTRIVPALLLILLGEGGRF